MDKKSIWLDINKLSEDDFTKPGERIPSDAGLADFIRYNVAHFNPTAEENLLGMAGSVSPLGKVSKHKSLEPLNKSLWNRLGLKYSDIADELKDIYAANSLTGSKDLEQVLSSKNSMKFLEENNSGLYNDLIDFMERNNLNEDSLKEILKQFEIRNIVSGIE